MNHWKNFRTDRLYLIKYLLVHTAIVLTILYIQSQSVSLDEILNAELSYWPLALLPLGLILAVQIPVLIHNTVHRNLKPPFLNFIAGELAGYYVLLSMATFELNHVMHHAHADSDLDPHNPYQRNFLGFFFANNFGGTRVVLAKYLEDHGDTFLNRRFFDLMVVLHFINVPLRLAFWVMLLGPSVFLFAFVPSYLFHMFVFAHINFVTHETTATGEAMVYNLDSNIYYRFVNFFGSGVYYHKNHHERPYLYNPKLGKSSFFLFR